MADWAKRLPSHLQAWRMPKRAKASPNSLLRASLVYHWLYGNEVHCKFHSYKKSGRESSKVYPRQANKRSTWEYPSEGKSLKSHKKIVVKSVNSTETCPSQAEWNLKLTEQLIVYCCLANLGSMLLTSSQWGPGHLWWLKGGMQFYFCHLIGTIFGSHWRPVQRAYN